MGISKTTSNTREEEARSLANSRETKGEAEAATAVNPGGGTSDTPLSTSNDDFETKVSSGGHEHIRMVNKITNPFSRIVFYCHPQRHESLHTYIFLYSREVTNGGDYHIIKGSSHVLVSARKINHHRQTIKK